ncbi:MAG: cation:proton antiporter, partial [Bacteroidales bacterium]|nr:cation:proton antiporter [Bacteroidales bacterium]
MKTKRFLSTKFIFLFTIISCWFGVYYSFGLPQEEKHQDKIEITGHEQEVVQQQEHADEHAEEHGSNLSPLFFVILALIIGAATRQGLRKSPLPFTVGLLLIGIGLGVAARIGWFETWSVGSIHINVKFLSNAVKWAGNIDPHVILFVFLPTLIFEAAFALDVHTFKKSVGNASILAIPGILVAMVLTATLAIGLDLAGIGLSGWGWPIALMFGAVVSATDPVAVVSLLKNLGASKKLGTLIEGE